MVIICSTIQFYCSYLFYFMEKIGQKEYSLFRFLIFTIFPGSVFLTSGKFVNATNTPKLYFVVLAVLLALLYAAICRKRINVYLIKNKTIGWDIIVVCFAQAFYGLCQFIGWFPSSHSKFAI